MAAQEDKPYLLIKFGTIKGGYYKDNPEALELSNKFNQLESDAERKKLECEVIDLFKGEIFSWWDQRVLTKHEAKDYIMDYPTS